jgi:hypothetical protein
MLSRSSLLCGLVLLASCAPAAVPCRSTEPPKSPAVGASTAMRAFYDLPVIEARQGPFASEEELLSVVSQLYAEHGFAQAGAVTLVQSEEVLIPFTSGSSIHSRRFFGDGPGFEQHLARVSRAYYGGRLDGYRQHFPDERQAREAYQAFMIGAVGHELAHALSELRRANGRDNPWIEETRAVDFELALLGRLVAMQRLPSTWLTRWEQFNRALLAAAPPGLVQSLPATATEREALFNQSYPRLLDAAAGEGKEPDADARRAIDTTLALYTVYRLERAKGPLELRELRHALDPMREPNLLRTLARRELESRALAILSSEAEPVVRAELGAAAPGWQLEITTEEREPRSLVLRSQRRAPVPAVRRNATGELCGRIGARLALDACGIDPEQGVAWLATPVPLQDDPRPEFVRAMVERHLGLVGRWAALIDRVAAGRLTPRAAMAQAASSAVEPTPVPTPSSGAKIEPPKAPGDAPAPAPSPGPVIRDRGF